MRICDMKRIYWSSLSLYDLFLTRKVKRTEMKFENYLNQMEEEIVSLEKCYLDHIYKFVSFLKGSPGSPEETKAPIFTVAGFYSLKIKLNLKSIPVFFVLFHAACF